ncbi:MAG: hypothetical protein H6739_40315 [Alphaproteobacteria bacterium]|nr:hypothetical protein [Alphaproteobacteria bacterium]
MRALLIGTALALSACKGGGDTGEPWVTPGCGDGIVDPGEACDDGADNSDADPDACRTSCLAASCGDGVTDSDEACDDANAWGGDGCTPVCTAEDGELEVEPNDAWDAAQSWGGAIVHGALDVGDVDCVTVSPETCGALAAHLVGPCPVPATLNLYNPEGVLIAVGAPEADGCAVLDPAAAPGARFTAEGDWALCVEGLLGEAVPFYALEIEPISAADATFPMDEGDDPDGDGRPDRCDDDRDGDGVLDVDDNCPDVSNGPDTGPLSPDGEGFLRSWLAAGPYTGRSSADTCLPTADDLVGEDDAAARPALGDAAGEFVWTALWSGTSRIEYLTDYGGVSAPREVYTALYLRDPAARTLTLALGPDDGAVAWLDDAVVMEVNGCQGTNVDQFTEVVTLTGGWQRLMLKVYDQGGGWGTYARFLDEGNPVTDLELSLDPAGAWSPGQDDADGDGLGDVCDDTPTG